MRYWKTIEEACKHGKPFSLLLTCPECKIYFWFVEFMTCPKCHNLYPDEVDIPDVEYAPD